MAANYTITVAAGETIQDAFTWKQPSGAAVNLTGYTAKMQARDKAGLLILEAESGSGITLGGAAGTVTLSVPTTGVAAGGYAYDLFLTSGGGVVTQLVEGDLVVNPAVTQL